MLSVRRSLALRVSLLSAAALAGGSLGCEGELSGTGAEIEDTAVEAATSESGTTDTGVAETPDDSGVDSTVTETSTDGGGDTRDAADSRPAESGADTSDGALPDAPPADTSDAAPEDTSDTAIAADTRDSAVGCAAPTFGAVWISSTGSDSTGTGSLDCPFKTITKAFGVPGLSQITLVKSAAGPVIYGDGCTGGAPCDAMPIDVPATANMLTIRGDGAPADVVVQGSATSTKVFGVTAGGVAFDGLTIRPVMTGAANTGAHGIVFDYPALANDGTLRNVVISGTTGAAPTGSGVIAKGAAGVIIGPNVTITGGFHAVLVDVASGDAHAPTVTLSGNALGALTMSDAAGACVYVKSASATQTPMLTMTGGAATNVIIRDCGPAGAVVFDTLTPTTLSALARVNIGRTGTGTYPGLSLLGAATLSVNQTTISGLGANGISLAGSSKLMSTSGLVVTANAGAGILVSGTATVDLAAASITGQTGANGNGIFCAGSSATAVKLRSTKVLGNAQNGLRVLAGCGIDVAATAATDANVFNTATQANAVSGVCSQSTTALNYTNNRFRCAAPPATGCAAGTPVESKKANNANFACTAATDYTIINGSNAVVTGAECCQSVP